MINTEYTKISKSSLLADVDVAIIGGGVVGCAVARRMSLEGASVVLIEKAADILDGASKETAQSCILDLMLRLERLSGNVSKRGIKSTWIFVRASIYRF